MRLYSEIDLNEQLDRLHLSPKQKDNVRSLISAITERYSDQIESLANINIKAQNIIAELKMQIEKMKSFIYSEVDCCTYCTIAKECRNDEGTCQYFYATEEEQKNHIMTFIQKWELVE